LFLNTEGESVLPKGEYKVYIGTTSPSSRVPELGGAPILLTIDVR
jgi:hypothetical protein